ncbi:hypothetical protein [Flavobacterium sp. NRK F7]|uniref:hypothetical protein n=1 Tax=Flavobacterium sp. NRK F7 TaxID=2954930 RepID=UPI002090D3D2|nr:hypothetical protein [Flavobacterium sp. NRK F7]MCO6164178.1 hypothetical protein [Flavobacterium sp. NRK F7]
MKKLVILFSVFFFGTINSQSRLDNNKIISKIEKEILSTKVIKLELFKELGWAGGYEKTIIHLKNKIPILIEKEEKEVVHTYSYKGEDDIIRFIKAKFYIISWEKSDYIRVGKFENEGKEVIMPNEYIFEYDKNKIELKIKEY